MPDPDCGATNSRDWVTVAFLIGAGVMALGGLAELFLGVKAEIAQLEDIAKPLTAEEADEGALPGSDGDEAKDRTAAAEQRWRDRVDRRSAQERSGRRRRGPRPLPSCARRGDRRGTCASPLAHDRRAAGVRGAATR